MKKIVGMDIQNLYQKFGGDAGTYQEVQQAVVSESAQNNWPIIGAIEKVRVAALKLKSADSQSELHAAAPRPSHQDYQQKIPIQGGDSTIQIKQTTNSAPSQLASLVAPVKSAAMNQPYVASPLFGSLSAAPVSHPSKSTAPTPSAASISATLGAKLVEHRTEPVQSVGNDAIHSVFARLLNPQNQVVASVPEHGLSRLLDFLKG